MYIYLSVFTLKIEAYEISNDEKGNQGTLEECCKREGKLVDCRKQEMYLLGA